MYNMYVTVLMRIVDLCAMSTKYLVFSRHRAHGTSHGYLESSPYILYVLSSSSLTMSLLLRYSGTVLRPDTQCSSSARLCIRKKKKVKKKEKTRLTYIRPRLIVQRTNVRFARVSDFSIACYTIQVNDHWEERIILVVCFFILGISRDRRRIILLRFRNSILFSSFNLLTKL